MHADLPFVAQLFIFSASCFLLVATALLGVVVVEMIRGKF